jgi:myo-inositol-1-phosphate synthase
VTELPPFSHLQLTPLPKVVVGGHEVRGGRLRDHADRMWKESRAISPDLLEAASAALDAADSRIRPGTCLPASPRILKFVEEPWAPFDATARQAVARLRQDIESFRMENDLGHVVVVNIASTEHLPREPLPQQWHELDSLLDTAAWPALPSSSIYAIAAFEANASYINFTPSLGATPAAIQQLALSRRLPHAGYDGKSGETMLKAVLAPMFAARHLHVSSWVGHNILGNLDGWVLQDATHKEPKLRSKDHLVGEVLGYAPQSLVSIEFIESMGDWKTAWNHIHFEGFMSTRMAFQFTWQGCDSILAAPLVIDLARLAERAHRDGEYGPMPWLSFFFKSSPTPVPQDFASQWDALTAWSESKKVSRSTAGATPSTLDRHS